MTIDPNIQTPPVQEQKPTKDDSLVQLRKIMENERKMREDAEQRLAVLEQDRQKPKYDEDDDTEPYVDHKKLNKRFAQFEQNFEKKVDQVAEQKARSMIEQERQSEFLRRNPDFQQILSTDVIQKFAEKHPDLAEPMLEMPDNFARQKLLYQNIKALGLHKPPIPVPNIQDVVDKNRRSPYYQPSGSNAPPFSSQGDFSKAGQKNAYQRQQDLINNRRG